MRNRITQTKNEKQESLGVVQLEQRSWRSTAVTLVALLIRGRRGWPVRSEVDGEGRGGFHRGTKNRGDGQSGFGGDGYLLHSSISFSIEALIAN